VALTPPLREPRGLLVENQMTGVHAEPAPVAPRQQALEEALREALLLVARLEHQPPEGLGQQSLEIPVIRRSGHDGPAGEQESSVTRACTCGCQFAWLPKV
jgi:hypothetical protein